LTGEAHTPSDRNRERHQPTTSSPRWGEERVGLRPRCWPRPSRSGLAERGPDRRPWRDNDSAAKGGHPGRSRLRLRRGRRRCLPGRGSPASGAADVEVLPTDSAYVVKLLAVVERTADDEVSVRVHPTMVPKAHPLAGGPQCLQCRSSSKARPAGGAHALRPGLLEGRPTASAVLGDLNRRPLGNRLAGTTGPAPEAPARPALRSMADVRSPFYVTLDVERPPPGYSARVAGHVSAITGSPSRSMEQEGLGDAARLIFLTHAARERGDVQATLEDLATLPAVWAHRRRG